MKPPPRITILAIPGSLRPGSSSHAVIAAAASLFPSEVDFQVYHGVGSLPHFDDSSAPAPEVLDFRSRVGAAHGVLICSPEYAFGVPGSLKNALDWTVSSGELVYKPLALITAATGGDKAHAAWLLTFTALSASIAPEAALLISYIRSKMKEGAVTDPATLTAIQKVTTALMGTIKSVEESKDNE